MVQIIDDANQSISGSLGRSFGKGIGEQLPKGMERGMLSQGLKQLEQDKNLTPYQQAASLYSLPGGAEASQHLLPLLQQQQANKAYLQQNKMQQEREGEGRRETPASMSPYDRSQSHNYLVKSSPEEIKAIAAQEYAKNPALFRHDITKAETKIASEEESRFNQDTAAEARLGKVESEALKYINRETQKSGPGVYGDVSGAMVDDFIESAQKKTKVSPVEAGREAGREALEFAKSRQALRDIGKKSYWNKSAKESLTAFDRIKSKYKSLGKQEEFYNELISNADMTPEVAASFTYPVKDDPGLNSFINSKKPMTKLGKTLKVGKKSEIEIADYLAKHPNDDVSILSIADRLSDIGLNKTAFLSKVNEDYAQDKISLTKRQSRELEKTPSPRPSMGDIFYKSLLFKNPWRQSAK